MKEPTFVCTICDKECEVVHETWQNMKHKIMNRSICCGGPVIVAAEEEE